MTANCTITLLLLIMVFPQLTLQCKGNWTKNLSYRNIDMLSFLKNESGPSSY
jgi:hypothetical protein